MSNQNNLLAYPIIDELIYRSKIDPRQLNLMLKSIDESILRAIIRGTYINEKFSRLSLGVSAAYKSLEAHNQIYNQYPRSINIPSGEYGGACYATAFSDTSGGRQDKTAGLVTLNWDNNKKSSKIPVYNGKVNPSVSIYIDDNLREKDDPVYNILDNDGSTFWVEETTPGEHTLELRLPPSISKKFNYINIIPFPIFGIDITDITYYDLRTTAQSIYPSKDSPFYNRSGPITLHLSPREYNNTIKITFNVKEGVNTMGFTSIDISSIDYNDNSTTIIIPFENVPQVDHNGDPISTINPYDIDLDFYIDGAIESDYSSFISEISIVDREDSSNDVISLKKIRGPQTIGSSYINISQPSGNNALYLKMVINEVRLTTPAIRGAILNWREV